ncbi:MAG: low molecular weight phosphotyrosine protein phosphatase [Chloroflexi bacterium]|nr:MAG: low molecular weight phosphotyrosine protein phosphatase [Chloroflexota bacterium]MBL1196691.1 low molecular weight phosphotyrosine protein phosphatase [Chloroflexota bacterium]NOH13984.1 low molecular weight phosphotyrosine protein phosphatase [Chloroflexota bacterium]
MTDKTRILFVCLGNIVRSPLGEGLFRHHAEVAGLAEKYEVDSAGTGSYHVGESPDSRMRQVAAEKGFTYDGRARQVQPGDFEDFDLIIAMDTTNQNNLVDMAQSKEQAAKVHLMRAYDPEGDPNDSVPDPYYGGIQGFHNTYDIVERSVKSLLEALEAGEVDL